ncbi:MAG: methyltransferase domain-containing protein [Candidatus Binatus sp.]|jgi:ubiquinone/menaquinone biosynthesis C-methylase UbiE
MDDSVYMEHKDLVREEFTRQANDYAAAPAIRDADHLRKLVELAAPPADARVLEVATGPGHVAMAFAKVCREVVGIDLTDAPLKIAEKMRAERGLANVSFQKGDVESRLPFHDGEFDVVVCRFAIHHFAAPEKVIAEMARVCRVNGLVVIEDLIASEQSDRAAYYNEFERLRDTSHTSALPMSELIKMMGAAGLELTRFTSHGYYTPVSQWIKAADTSPDRAAKAIEMVERDAKEDLSGTRPKQINGELHFAYRIAMLVTRKLPTRLS